MQVVVVTRGGSDFLEQLAKLCTVVCCTPETFSTAAVEDCEVLCLLGGTLEKPMALPPASRLRLEQWRRQGKRVFAEYTESVGDSYCDNPIVSGHHRLIVFNDAVAELKRGDLLDDHDNRFLPFYCVNASAAPILVYRDYIAAHDRVETVEDPGAAGWGLWTLDEHTLMCSFRLCNFIKARLAPQERWNAVVRYIFRWITGKEWDGQYEPICRCTGKDAGALRSLNNTVERGMAWFDRAGLLQDEGRSGVLEGFSHHIAADGSQAVCPDIRTDCCGEVAGAYRFHARLTGDALSRQRASNLEDCVFSYCQVKEGMHRGMLRWSNKAFGVCYQDDAARAILPLLLDIRLGAECEHEAELQAALDYMVRTTGSDGLRPARTDCFNMTEESIKAMAEKPCGFACAHYNAFYHAALLLGYQIWQNECYLETAVKGLTSLMERYPDLRREQSETEELCRMIFPLSCLYDVTGEALHLRWLLQIEEDLQRFRVENGGYREWDTDYKAAFSRGVGSECSLLAENGDPVIDLLYSNNWLPLGFAHAYRVTGDKRFLSDFKGVANMLMQAQLKSNEPHLDGAWTRAYDYSRNEPYGVPHDAGWGPCCMESGWINGEILIGLQYGMLYFGEELTE